jgi:antitoxin YefM
LKTAFGNKEIEIVVSEADETEYLLRSPSNRAHLLKAVADVEAGQNLVQVDQQPFQ